MSRPHQNRHGCSIWQSFPFQLTARDPRCHLRRTFVRRGERVRVSLRPRPLVSSERTSKVYQGWMNARRLNTLIISILPQYHGWYIKRKILHTNILRTSRMIYEEAWPILYHKNLFCYEVFTKCKHYKNGITVVFGFFWAYSDVCKILHITAVLDDNVRSFYRVQITLGPNYCCVNYRGIVFMADYITVLRCELKTLRLQICLNDGIVGPWQYTTAGVKRPSIDDIASNKVRVFKF